jgi:hypothetical protein
MARETGKSNPVSKPKPRAARTVKARVAADAQIVDARVERALEPESSPQMVQVLESEKGDIAMTTETTTAPPTGTPLLNGVKAAGEAYIIPGASLMLDGNVKGGVIHMAGAYAARALFGPIGWAYFAADSFSLSVSGKHIYQQFSKPTAS